MSISVRTVPSDFDRAFDELMKRWPPRGLVTDPPVSERSGGGRQPPLEPALLIEVDIGSDGTAVVIVDGAPADGGWDRAESALGLFAAEHLAERVAVHAAVLMTSDGAIVVPGPSHSGKSTLAVAARRRGWLVLSDEYALVDVGSGKVQGWPRPLRQRTPQGPERITLDECERAAAFVDQEVAMVAALRHAADEPASFGPIDRADMVLRVLENTVCGAVRPEATFRAALALTEGTATIGGVRGEADAALDELLGHLRTQ